MVRNQCSSGLHVGIYRWANCTCDKHYSYEEKLRSGDTQPVTHIRQFRRKQQLALRARAFPILPALAPAAREGFGQQNKELYHGSDLKQSHILHSGDICNVDA